MAMKVRVDAVMGEIERDVRARLRRHLLKTGGAADYQDQEIFDAVHALLDPRRSTAANLDATLLPELVDGDVDWRLQTHLDPHHASPAAGRFILFAKKKLLLPLTALAVRVQPGELPPPGSSQPRAVRLHRGARARERPPSPSDRRSAPMNQPADEAGVRRSSVRGRHRRRLRRALPAHRRASRRAARRHHHHDLRQGSHHLAESLSAGRLACAEAPAAGRPHCVLRFPVARERDMHRFMDLSDLMVAGSRDRGGAGAVVPRERPRTRRSCSTTCGSTAPTSTACCSGPIAMPAPYFGLPLVADRAGAGADRRRRSADSRRRAERLLRAAERLPVPDAGRGGAGGVADARAAGRAAVIGCGLDPAAEPRRICRRSTRSDWPIRSCCISGGSIRTKGARR